MVNDPIADMLIQIKNASRAGRKNVDIPHSHMKEEVARVLEVEGYIDYFHKRGVGPKFILHIGLTYSNGSSVITDVKHISKPGMRVYVGKRAIPTVVGGIGIAILSTPQGLMTGEEAKKRGIGGELLCEIW